MCEAKPSYVSFAFYSRCSDRFAIGKAPPKRKDTHLRVFSFLENATP